MTSSGDVVIAAPRVPRIDPSVRHVGVLALRKLSADRLRNLSQTFVIQDGDKPLAVLLNYSVFMKLQEEMEWLSVADPDDLSGLLLNQGEKHERI